MDSEDRKEENSASQSQQAYTLNQVYDQVGGFGTYQWYSTFFLILAFQTAGDLFYTTSYLELYPEYFCLRQGENIYGICDKTYLYENQETPYIVNWQSPYSLVNWVARLDLLYTSPTKIGLIGSMFFLGWTFTSIFQPRISDIKGRKWQVQIAIIAQVFVYLALILSKNLNLTIVLFLLFGFCSTGRSQILYIYMVEMCPQRSRVAVGTALNCIDGAIMIISSLYFEFISKNWLYFQIFGISTNLISIVATIWLPESPEFLYGMKRFNEARKVFNTIATVNRAKKFHGIFDTEYLQYKSQLAVKGEEIEEKINTMITDQTALRGEEDDQNSQVLVLSGSWKDLFRIKIFLVNTIILVLLWTIASFDYYLINFQLQFLSGNIYNNTMLSSFSEILAYILAGVFIKIMNMKIAFAVSYLFSAAGGVVYLLYGDANPAVVPYMVLAIKFGVSSAFNIAYIANADLYPAVLSGTIFGITNIFARLASMFAPVIAEIKDPYPMLFFTILAGVAGVLSFFLILKVPKCK